jgi:hypothetical protein
MEGKLNHARQWRIIRQPVRQGAQAGKQLAAFCATMLDTETLAAPGEGI